MHGVMRLFSNFKEFYNDINGATLTGAIDVIVVEQPDGSFNCSPFHVRFGKLGVLRSKEKVVDIEINGEPQDIHMKLGESGEAFFVEEIEDDVEEIPEHLATSPIPVSEFENMFKNQGRRLSFNFEKDINEIRDIENEANEYSKRRYTADSESNKVLERNFIKRQIGLGNLEVRENSAEDMTLSLTSNKHSSEDLSRSNNDISETIFKMDSLDENSKADSVVCEDKLKTPTPTPVKNVELEFDSKSSKKKRKKMKKKGAPRKSKSVNQMTISQTSENLDKTNDSVTDRSSIGSNSTDPDIKDMTFEKEQKDIAANEPNTSIKKIDADFHFFSDTELTANGNLDSRTDSPLHIETVQSDSEFEVKCRVKEHEQETQKSWEWGGFPSVSQTTSPTSEGPSKTAERRWELSDMFSFMKTKHGSTQQYLDGGIYLSDIASGSIDQDVAEMFFNQKRDKRLDTDLDCESGNGPSLQSPSSPDGCKSLDSDFDEHNKLAHSHNISLSLCGWDPEPNKERFTEHLVKFSDMCNDPTIVENPNLVVRIKDQYYTWKVAAPIMASMMIYGRPLVQSTIDQLCTTYMTVPKDGSKHDQEAGTREEKYSWWSWRRHRSSRENTPAAEDAIKPTDSKDASTVVVTTTDITEEVKEGGSAEEKPLSKEIPIPKITREQEEERRISYSTNKSPNSEKCKKTLRLSSKQIASLNLRDGMNEVEFSVTTAYQGTTRCQCHLYKWKWDDKIVISDIDGTITKSDVLGHILPIVGKDWAQSGVAQLFNKIYNNGYKLLYLSARAIGQARITREYLKSIKQGNLTMPDGPILLNPTSLITAFHREVIEKKPEQFKISCMSDIKALFPPDSNPFYAGYGNRINDVWAYRAVGIPIVRIFTINPKGELKHELTQTFQSSYSIMSHIVDHLFPSRVEAANDYSQFVYWRDPLPLVEELPEAT